MSTAEVDPDVVRWSAPPQEREGRPLLVVMHGFGADESDLFDLVSFFPESLVAASLRAPLALGPGYAWFPPRAGSGPARDPFQEAAVQGVLGWLDDLMARPTSVGLLGFSQGGAMALELLRRRPEAFSYVVLLSGFLAGQSEFPGDAELQTLRPPVFWGRGALDSAISRQMIDQTSTWLESRSTLDARVYQGLGHGISEQELFDFSDFIGAHVSDR